MPNCPIRDASLGVLRCSGAGDSNIDGREGVGYRGPCRAFNTMVFLRGNPRHHSVAFQPRMPDLPRSRDKRMWHFMLEANSIDDVGSALDLASKAGVPVASTLGRHSNDQMVSFYMSTPSGFESWYGC